MNAHGPIIELPEKGRRCALTILFSDLCDSTLIASRIDPEIYADFLVAQRDIFDTIVARHRGIVARVDGDGALCLFGYPDMRDHGTKPALEAALELHAAIAQLESQFDFSGTPVRLHSAINTGVVLLKNGDMVRGRYEVLGDVTNIAAKLCDFAAPNQIIISETALGADRQHFELGASQKVLLAGRARKTSIVSVLGKKARGNATHHMVPHDGLGRFVGRQAQLDELKGWLSHTGVASSNVAILFGPAGIGKTRLLSELLKSAQAADVRFVIGACDDQIGTHPLQPFFQILAQIHPGAPSQQAGLPDTSQIQAFAQAFCADLAHFSAQGRSLIVIEDWHWASDLARLMLNIILGELPSNVRVLLSSRNNIPDIIGGRLVTHVEVPPWTPRETSTAAAHMLGLPDVVASQWLEASSGGNPLFLQELCYGVRRGEIRDNGDTKSAWLEALIQSRFSQLPQDQAEILQAAAVLGQVSPAWLFEAVADVGYDDDRVCALIAADFLSHSDLSDTIRFKHGITKDAVYALIGPNARRDWHGRAADALLARSRALGEAAYLDGLAYHCFAAGRTEQALDYSMKVGEIALHTGSLDRAQVHFSNAFKLTAKLQERERANALYWSIINKFGLSCIVDPAPSHLEWMGLMVKEIERVGTQRQKARGAYWLGTLHYGLGNGWESVAHLRAARIMAAEARDERLVTQIDVKLAQSLFATGQYNEAKDAFDGVFDQIRLGHNPLDHETDCYARTCYGVMLADQGDRDIMDAHFQPPERMLTKAPSPLNASVLTLRAAYCILWGDLAGGLAYCHRCLDNAKSIHTPFQIMYAHVCIAFIGWKDTKDPECLTALRQSALWFEQDNSLQRTSLVYAMVADAYCEAGDIAHARSFAARAIRRIQKGGDHFGVPWAYRTTARLALKSGSLARAQRSLKKAYWASAVKRSRREHGLTLMLEAEMVMARGEFDQARTLLQTAIADFEAMGAVAFVAEARSLLAQLSIPIIATHAPL